MNASDQQTVHVELAERSYDIQIGSGNIGTVGDLLVLYGPVTHAVVISDTNVTDYASQVAKSIADIGANVDLLTVEPGEPSKTVASAAALWEEMLAAGTDRKSVVVAVGGGVVGDLAGFMAATFARGLAFFQVPTTLLAQVDSSVGGKTGINLSSAKNMVGAFWQPIGVLIDTAVLKTLPEREYSAGLAEVIKYGVIQDADFFSYLEEHVFEIKQRNDEVLRYIIARCCRLKADVVEQDERETTGLRAILNYGHTFAHALEAASGYGELLHGEAVAIGMLCASRVAEAMGRIDEDVTRRQNMLVQAMGLPINVPRYPTERLIELMRNDKKVEYGELRFILPDRLGHVELVGNVDPEHVRAAIEIG